MLERIQDSILTSMEWTDVLDIGLMSVFFYLVLRLIRGTRALQIMVALLMLGALYIFAEWMRLSTLHWVLEKFFVYLVLAVLILFQEDIRRGLARAGGRFLVGRSSEMDASVQESLLQAAYALASRRIGSLMVIERSTGLDELIHSGTQLDALVTQDLLMSIFHPTSPLHDGAVVIQQSRLRAAQVILPLTSSETLDAQYGTRHRAALGLSEATDAVVIVVSEQRGKVSVVHQGSLEAIEDADQLRERLQELLRSQPRTLSTGAVDA